MKKRDGGGRHAPRACAATAASGAIRVAASVRILAREGSRSGRGPTSTRARSARTTRDEEAADDPTDSVRFRVPSSMSLHDRPREVVAVVLDDLDDSDVLGTKDDPIDLDGFYVPKKPRRGKERMYGTRRSATCSRLEHERDPSAPNLSLPTSNSHPTCQSPFQCWCPMPKKRKAQRTGEEYGTIQQDDPTTWRTPVRAG